MALIKFGHGSCVRSMPPAQRIDPNAAHSSPTLSFVVLPHFYALTRLHLMNAASKTVSFHQTTVALSLALALSACGGGGGGSPDVAPAAPVIGTQPAAAAALQGQAATFAVTSSDTAATYQWQLNGANLANGSLAAGACAGATVAGANSASLTLSTLPSACDKSAVSVVLTNAGRSTTSTSAALTVVGFTQQPANKATFANSEVTVEAATAAAPALTYQWRLNGIALADGTLTAGVCAGAVAQGATTTRLRLSGVPLACNAAQLNVVAALGGASLSSDTAQLAVSEVTTAPRPTTVMAGSAANFQVVTAGAGSLSYAWLVGGQAVSNGAVTTGACAGAVVDGANTANLVLRTAPTGCHNTAVSVEITNASGTKLTTPAAALNVVGFGSQPTAPAGLVSGAEAVFSAPAAGAALAGSTQWFLSDVALTNGLVTSGACGGMSVSGATTATLSLSNIPLTCHAATVKATLTTTLGTTSTTPAVLAIGPGDARNGTYKAFASDGAIYDLVVNFNANTYELRAASGTPGAGAPVVGSMTANAKPNGAAEAGTYALSAIGPAGQAGALRYGDDVLVGSLPSRAGTDAVAFIAARKFVASASEFAAPVALRVMGREFAATQAAPTSSIFTGQLSAAGFVFCSGNAIVEVSNCAAGGNTLINYTTSYQADGGILLVNTADSADTAVSYVAKMGTEYVYLRAGLNSSGLTRLRYGIQSTPSLSVTGAAGASTDGAWTSTNATTQLTITGVGAGNVAVATRTASSRNTALASGLYNFADTNLAGATYFVAQSGRLLIVNGARNAAFPSVNGYLMLALLP
jgi:hypothetical protein